jgi:hypothetical protein
MIVLCGAQGNAPAARRRACGPTAARGHPIVGPKWLRHVHEQAASRTLDARTNLPQDRPHGLVACREQRSCGAGARLEHGAVARARSPGRHAEQRRRAFGQLPAAGRGIPHLSTATFGSWPDRRPLLLLLFFPARIRPPSRSTRSISSRRAADAQHVDGAARVDAHAREARVPWHARKSGSASGRKAVATGTASSHGAPTHRRTSAAASVSLSAASYASASVSAKESAASMRCRCGAARSASEKTFVCARTVGPRSSGARRGKRARRLRWVRTRRRQEERARGRGRKSGSGRGAMPAGGRGSSRRGRKEWRGRRVHLNGFAGFKRRCPARS